MKVLQINTVYGVGSTGKIAKQIHDLCIANGMECLVGHRDNGRRPFEDTLEISGRLNGRLHGFLARMTMLKGCFSYFKTKKFIRKIKKYGPDLIHLHNLHGSYVHIGVLMKYIKEEQIPVVFTLHDCWAFTAICPHFSFAGCDKWKSGCGHCRQRHKYSSAPIDLSRTIWKYKKRWFSGVPQMTVVTPSAWLADLARQSFLGQYPIKVIHNGIDLSVFSPTASDFRARYSLENKKIVLAVSFGWSYEKGLDVVIALAERLPSDYQIVLVGTDEATDKQLPENIISIHRTNNQEELASIYSATDVFINPTREEVLGLVNIEALACGTPVVTFRTGGSPECIDKTCGSVVDINDVDSMEQEIIRVCTKHPYTQKDCLRRAKAFDKNERMKEYIALYCSMGRTQL
ncbi:MAG: glycosyltransferase [Eubacteriales bacterium]